MVSVLLLLKRQNLSQRSLWGFPSYLIFLGLITLISISLKASLKLPNSSLPLEDLIGDTKSSIHIITSKEVSHNTINSLEIARYRRLNVRIVYVGRKKALLPGKSLYYSLRTRFLKNRAKKLFSHLNTDFILVVGPQIYYKYHNLHGPSKLIKYEKPQSSLVDELHNLFAKKNIKKYKSPRIRYESNSYKRSRLPQVPKYLNRR